MATPAALGATNAHATPIDEVFVALRTGATGLSQGEAEARLREYGPNQLPSPPPPHFAAVFLRQFLNPLIYVLLIVGAISVALGHGTDAAFILGVLVLNAVIGTAQEYSAEKSALALRQVASGRSRVLRDGAEVEIESADIVLGDIVWLESGMKVPADLRLISTHGAEVDESLLTGESLPVEKDAGGTVAPDAPLGDRKTMAFAGTLVTRGRAKGIVTGTGLASELGKIADAVLGHVSTKTPLIIRMEEFTKKLTIAFAAVVVLIGAILIFRGDPPAEVLLIAVALGVAAIPEGLPVALTIALAIASRRMAKRNVIVRKLSSVEALGSCTYIGTDKTGTLTVNELTAKVIARPGGAMYQVSGSGRAADGEIKAENPEPGAEEWLTEIAQAVALCNEGSLTERNGAWVSQGDAVDIALLALAYKAGLNAATLGAAFTPRARIPFEPELQYAATLHDSAKGQRISVKGAMERLLPMCGPVDAAAVEKQATVLATKGFRVLAVAAGTPSSPLDSLEPSDLTGLTFMGLVGMIDPLRPDARKAIESARSAGIQVAMITGDHPVTALAIAQDLGLAQEGEKAVTGPALRAAATPEAMAAAIRGAKVFARVEPQQKLQIVETLIKQGHFIAVTGDGANDAPALRAAHVGVAMGKSGTDVAKETADLIISDDRFSSLIAGIEEGRVAYANVRKVIYLLIATGAAEIVMIFLSILSGLPVPLTAVQLLWLNLVTEGTQGVALAFEPKEGDELKRPPRDPEEPIFNSLMIERVTLSAILMGVVSFLVYRTLLESGMDQAVAQNHVLLLMVLFENVLIGNARSETVLGFKISPLRNPFLLLGVLGAQGLHIAAMHFPPLQRLLGTSPVTFREWLYHLALASSLFFAIELHKWVRLNWPGKAGRGVPASG